MTYLQTIEVCWGLVQSLGVITPFLVVLRQYFFIFVEVANIAVVHIKMNTSKEKVINVHMKDGKSTNFKSCAEGLLYTNLNDPTMITNPTNFSLNAYSYLSIVKHNSEFLLILKLK